MTTSTPARAYAALVEHQVGGADGWNLKDVIRDLHEWAEVFRVRFKLEIPAVPLRLAPLRWNCLGHFNPGHNDFGLVNEIAIDIGHVTTCLGSGEWWEVLGTLLHEQLHYCQQLTGEPAKPGPGNYHNVQYRVKAGQLGLLVSSRGVSLGYPEDGPFWLLLKERGVELPEIPPAVHRERPRVGSKLKKWSCRCHPPVNVRVAVAEFNALCMECNTPFERRD